MVLVLVLVMALVMVIVTAKLVVVLKQELMLLQISIVPTGALTMDTMLNQQLLSCMVFTLPHRYIGQCLNQVEMNL
jgi:hypothetical protein